MNNLNINKNLFRRGGILGRMDYFKNMMILFAATMVIYIVSFREVITNEALEAAFFVTMLVLLIGISYLSLINSFKRLRDLRGKTHNEIPFQIGLAVLMAIPYLSIIPLGILLFAEGAVTGHGSIFGRLESSLSNNRFEESKEEREAKKIDNLSRLYHLKETGGISEDEYKHYKDDVFKKSS
ncbi:hypothetical protein [Peredibacter starrii]|uniref:SHOCT domain-containing protein n=1 Tax=Peredibacter starrii TaxID=28202 RepID=A0AAX4HUX3_9BACT|nr:hypothetical protein [Peredibacter starrii]WPU67079.1 hypothetical protein SOO65_09970 [Peredibacter starrii]